MFGRNKTHEALKKEHKDLKEIHKATCEDVERLVREHTQCRADNQLAHALIAALQEQLQRSHDLIDVISHILSAKALSRLSQSVLKEIEQWRKDARVVMDGKEPEKEDDNGGC